MSVVGVVDTHDLTVFLENRQMPLDTLTIDLRSFVESGIEDRSVCTLADSIRSCARAVSLEQALHVKWLLQYYLAAFESVLR